MDADRIIADIASAQHSAVTRSQLLGRGVSRGELDRRLAWRILPVTWDDLVPDPAELLLVIAVSYTHLTLPTTPYV